MGFPQIKVQIAFASNPLAASPTWVDVSDYLRGDEAVVITTRRGRQYELNRFEAGTATVVLNNHDRRFDPTYASSPYYPYVIPTRQIRIQAVWSSITYTIFTGFIENWPMVYPGGQDAKVTIRCVDAFKYFANTKISIDLATNYTDQLVDQVLSATNWTSRETNITGSVGMTAATSYTATSALQILQTLMDTQNGLFFMRGNGNSFYGGRHWRILTKRSSLNTFGNQSGELPYADIEPAFDDTAIYNDIHVTRSGGVEQVAADATSQARFFNRSLSRTSMLFTTDNEAQGMANWLLSQYKNPDVRFKRLVLNGGLSDSLWSVILGREINDRITVRHRPPGGGMTERDCHIEAIEHQIGRGTWQTTWQLSPASTLNYWVLGDTNLSVLGTSTVPGF